MILGRDRHVHAAAFDEIHRAVQELRGRWGSSGIFFPYKVWTYPFDPIVFNAHSFPDEIPATGIVYNLENVGIQVDPMSFSDHKVWDFSERNVEKWRRKSQISASGFKRWNNVQHVPVGHHHTMEGRFEKVPWSECKYDVVFTGAPNERRNYIIDTLMARGLRVCQVPCGVYGRERDAILATSKLALNMLYYEDGLHPILRTSHAVANRLPILCETSPEIPDWALLRCDYSALADKCVQLVTRRREFLDHMSEAAYIAFRMHPMVLPA